MIHTRKEAKQNLERDLQKLIQINKNNEMRKNFLETSIACWKIRLGA